MTEPESRYDRGHLDGQTAATIAEHTKHLDKINGSMAEMVLRLGDVVTQQNKALEQASARDAVLAQVAAALEKASTERREIATARYQEKESSWLRRNAVAIGALLISAASLYLAYSITHPT